MVFDFTFPDIGEGIQEGKILQWRCSPGDELREGDILAAVETDKVVAEIPSPRNGVLLRRGAGEGEVIRVGEVLAFIDVDSEGEPDSAGEEADGGNEEDGEGVTAGGTVVGSLEGIGGGLLPPSTEGVVDGATGEAATVEKQAGLSPRPTATPVARKLASDSGVDLATLKGSGPDGRVTKRDILDAVEKSRSRQGKPRQPDRTFTLSTVRKTIARNMEKSALIPSAALHDSAIVDELVRSREELNRLRGGGEGSPRYSFLPFFFKLTALALRDFDLLNASFDPDRDDVSVHGAVHMGFAVDTEEGLVVPVIRDIDRLTLTEIQDEVSRLIDSARKRSLALADIRGGTFTVSVYGTIGGLHAKPMILPPQVAILGVGRIHREPAVIDGSVRPAHVLPLSLVIDHRVIDGATASRFMNRLRTYMSTPSVLIADLR